MTARDTMGVVLLIMQNSMRPSMVLLTTHNRARPSMVTIWPQYGHTMATPSSQAFEEIDINGDGVIDLHEWNRARGVAQAS